MDPRKRSNLVALAPSPRGLAHLLHLYHSHDFTYDLKVSATKDASEKNRINYSIRRELRGLQGGPSSSHGEGSSVFELREVKVLLEKDQTFSLPADVALARVGDTTLRIVFPE